MGLRMKNFNIMGVHWKIPYLGESSQKTLYKELLDKKAQTICRFNSRLGKKEGGSSGFDNLCTQHMYIPLSYRYLGMIGILWYPRGILFVSKTYKSDPSQTRFPVVFVLKNLLYPTILKKLSLVSKLLGNSLDKWF